MLNKIKNFIFENNLMKDSNKVVLAFSYGIDSRVLLDILLKLGYDVTLAHVNHKVRKESDIEEIETKKLAQKLNIKCFTMTLDKQDGNFHDSARTKRYEFFKSVASFVETNQIITAHHLSDNLETILINLTKGSNLYGYSGISYEVTSDNYKIYRPLMCVTKDEILNYQRQNNIEFFEDESNSHLDYMRNRIRHKVIPSLKEENPNIENTIISYSNILKDAFNFIRSLTIKYLNKNSGKIKISEFRDLDKALRYDIVSYMLEELNLNKTYFLIELIDNFLLSDKAQGSINLNSGYEFKKRYDDAYIEKATVCEPVYIEFDIDDVIYIHNLKLFFTKKTPSCDTKHIKLCYNDLVFPLTIRNRKNGDNIKMPYGHKKIKDLLMDLHMPIEERDKVLLLENKKEILWVLDIAKSQALVDMKNKADLYLVYEVVKNDE